MYLVDVISDVFFVAQIVIFYDVFATNYNNSNSSGEDVTGLIFVIIGGLAFFFIVLPVGINLFQLKDEIKD